MVAITTGGFHFCILSLQKTLNLVRPRDGGTTFPYWLSKPRQDVLLLVPVGIYPDLEGEVMCGCKPVLSSGGHPGRFNSEVSECSEVFFRSLSREHRPNGTAIPGR